MRCGKARDWLSLAVDRQLPPNKTLSLENHLEHCADCRQYKVDLQLGQRLLRATTPTLSENFDWRLQLKLNQTLKAAAGEAVFPWHQSRLRTVRWWRSLGWSALAGAAAMLLIGLLALPPAASLRSSLLADLTQEGTRLEPVAGSLTGNRAFADRTQFSPSSYSGLDGLSPGRTVNSTPVGPFTVANRYGGGRGISRESLFSASSLVDMWRENHLLKLQVADLNREIGLLKAQLDTSHVVIQHLQGKDD